MSKFEKLFQPTNIEAFDLHTRTAMAPMTRCFADPETGVVGQDVVDYYRRRAKDGIGLIISEGIVISERAKEILAFRVSIHRNKLIHGSL